MQYEIKGNNLPFVSFKLNREEELYTTSGAMSWMSDKISMETSASGGLLSGMKRMFSGESFFTVNFKALADNQTIAFSASFPGSIYAVNLEPGRSIIAQKRAFLVAEKGVNLAIHFHKKLGTGFFGGEGLFLTTLTGPGKVYLQSIPIQNFARSILPFIPSQSS